MLRRDRKQKEYKSIIVYTRKGNTTCCYCFTTFDRNGPTLPSGANKYVTFDKIAERVEIHWNVGGDVFITLYDTHPNGFEVTEEVVFDRKYVTSIRIETDFANLR